MQLLCQTQQAKVPLLPRRVLGAKGMEGPGTGPCFALVGAHGVRHRNVSAFRWIIISVNELQEMSLSGITVMNGFGFWSSFPALVTVSVSHQSWGNAFKDQESFPGSRVRFSRQCFQELGRNSTPQALGWMCGTARKGHGVWSWMGRTCSLNRKHGLNGLNKHNPWGERRK